MILVTGATGFIGLALCRHLRAAGVAVRGVGRGDLDLADAKATRAALADGGTTTVVHLAASLDRRETPEGHDLQWRNTLLAGRTLFDAARAAGVGHFIAMGSIDELGPREGVIEEASPAAPVSLYGTCKHLLREYMAARLRTEGPLMAVDWVRPFVVYGPGQRGGMLLPYAVQQALVGVPADVSDGEQRRDFLFIDDLVAALALLARSPVSNGGLSVHHLGSGVATRVRDVLSLVATHTGGQFRFGARPRREGEPNLQVAPRPGDRRLESWCCETTVDVGVLRTIEWWRREDPC